MDYNEFIAKAQEDLAAALPGTVVSRENISKLQGESYEGLAVRQEGSHMAVMLNMQVMYARMEAGADYKQVLSDMQDIIHDHAPGVQPEKMDFLYDYDQVQDRLTVDLVGQDRNRDKLADIPHFDMEDLSLVYRIDVSDQVNGEGRATVLVTNAMLEKYGITAEQLHQDALKNASIREPAVIQSMGMVLSGVTGMPLLQEEVPMTYVASNSSMMYGASVAAYPGFMEKAAEQVKGDFFILPSSVHEILLLKDDGKTDYRGLEEMVSEINTMQVAPEEQLSDRVYHYDSREKVFELAEKYEARTRGREEQKHSVLADLKSFGEKSEQQRPERAKPAPAREMAL